MSRDNIAQPNKNRISSRNSTSSQKYRHDNLLPPPSILHTQKSLTKLLEEPIHPHSYTTLNFFKEGDKIKKSNNFYANQTNLHKKNLKCHRAGGNHLEEGDSIAGNVQKRQNNYIEHLRLIRERKLQHLKNLQNITESLPVILNATYIY